MGKLGISLGLLVSQMVNFGLLAAILYLLLYKPVLRVLQERRERIAKAMADADAARESAARAQLEYDRQVVEAKRKAQEIISQASQKAELVRAEIVAQTQHEADGILAKARQQAEVERAQILAESQGTIVDLALAGARQVLRKELSDPDRHRQSVEQFLTELSAN